MLSCIERSFNFPLGSVNKKLISLSEQSLLETMLLYSFAIECCKVEQRTSGLVTISLLNKVVISVNGALHPWIPTGDQYDLILLNLTTILV